MQVHTWVPILGLHCAPDHWPYSCTLDSNSFCSFCLRPCPAVLRGLFLTLCSETITGGVRNEIQIGHMPSKNPACYVLLWLPDSTSLWLLVSALKSFLSGYDSTFQESVLLVALVNSRVCPLSILCHVGIFCLFLLIVLVLLSKDHNSLPWTLEDGTRGQSILTQYRTKWPQKKE